MVILTPLLIYQVSAFADVISLIGTFTNVKSFLRKRVGVIQKINTLETDKNKT
jgi:hypothetical protein